MERCISQSEVDLGILTSLRNTLLSTWLHPHQYYLSNLFEMRRKMLSSKVWLVNTVYVIGTFLVVFKLWAPILSNASPLFFSSAYPAGHSSKIVPNYPPISISDKMPLIYTIFILFVLPISPTPTTSISFTALIYTGIRTTPSQYYPAFSPSANKCAF